MHIAGLMRPQIVLGTSLACALTIVTGTCSLAGAQMVEVRPGSTEFDLPSPGKGTAGSSSLTGVVVDAQTGVPVEAAVVSLGRTGIQGSVMTAVADSQGRFVFVELPTGTSYTLMASRYDYRESAYAGNRDGDGPPRRPVEIALADKEWRQGVKIQMWRLAEISGVVADEFGEPLVGVTVRAFTRTAVHSKTYLAGSPLAVTDDRGVYRLPSLRPGSYLVGVIGSQATVPSSIPEVPQRGAIGELMSGGRSVDDEARVVSGPVLSSGDGHRLVVSPLLREPAGPDKPARIYQPQFYPAGSSPALAQPVTVGFAERREAVDFRLQPVRVYRVSGRLPPGATPASLPLLRLLPRGFEELGLGNEVATTVVADDGSFTFLGVPSGEYTISAQTLGLEFVTQPGGPRAPNPAGFSAGPVGGGTFPRMPNLSVLDRTTTRGSYWGALPVDVADADVAGLMLPLRPTLSIRGRVEIEGAAVLPPSQSRIYVTAEPANGDPTLGRPNTSAGRGLPGDSFSLDGLLPGTYILHGSYFPVRSVNWQGKDVTEIGVDASAGNDIDDVVITLTAAETELKGMVPGAGRGDPPAAVVVFPTDPALWSNYGWMPRRLRSILVGGDGSYSFRNLPAGDYYVTAVDSALADAWVDPRMLKDFSAQATKVTLRWGERITQDVPLRPVRVK
jgi:hypothetical protein